MSDIIPLSRYIQKFEGCIHPLTSFVYKKLGLTPNYLTLIGLLVGLTSAFYLIQSKFIISFILFALSTLFDILDGIVARQFNLKNSIGSTIDDTADHLTVVAFILALYYTSMVSASLAILTILIISFNVIIKNFGKFDLGFRRLVVLGYFIGFPLSLIIVIVGNTVSSLVNIYKLNKSR